MYQIFLTSQAQKDLGKIPPKDGEKIKKKLGFLGKNPLSGKKLMGSLKGLFSLRIWPYRAVYFVKKNKQEIWVVHIAHRQGVYK